VSAPSTLDERLALIFTPASRRAALLALNTVISEITASLASGLDHHVAHTRLGWWREEVARLQRGAPVHPAGRQLLADAPKARYALLEQVLTATEYQLAGHEPGDEATLTALIDRLYGAPEILRAEVVHGSASPSLHAFGETLGRAFGYAAVAAAAPPGVATTADVARVRTALNALSPDTALATAERPALVRAALLAARLGTEGFVTPPGPLRALFIAWRTARRHRLEL
jgi:hypothetical protein